MTSNKESIHLTMFKNKPATSILSNDRNELVGIRGYCGTIAEVKVDFSRHVASTGADPTCLGRQNHVDVQNGRNKQRFISACQSVKSTSTLGTVYSERRKSFFSQRHQHLS